MTDQKYDYLHSLLKEFIKIKELKVVKNPFVLIFVLLTTPAHASKVIFDSEYNAAAFVRDSIDTMRAEGFPCRLSVEEFCQTVDDMASRITSWESSLSIFFTSFLAALALGVSVYAEEWSPIVVAAAFIYPLIMYGQLRLKSYANCLRDFSRRIKLLEMTDHV